MLLECMCQEVINAEKLMYILKGYVVFVKEINKSSDSYV